MPCPYWRVDADSVGVAYIVLRSLTLFEIRHSDKVKNNDKVQTTTPAVSCVRDCVHLAAWAQAEAYATQLHRVALLSGAVPRHLPTGVARIVRFLAALSAILILALPSARTVSFAQTDRTVVKVANFAELAHELASGLEACGVQRVAIVDFEYPMDHVDEFGVWLADQLAAAPAERWAPIEVIGRKQIAAKWDELRIAEPYTTEPDRRLDLAKAFHAALIQGSYSPADNGIGIELSAPGTKCTRPLIVKFAMTDEMKAHLTKPLEAMAPGDGAYPAGVGGISLPACMYCPNPSFKIEELNGKPQGTVLLMVIIDAQGRAGEVTVKNAPAPKLGERAINAVKRWRFRPAVDVDGKPVAARTPVLMTFRVW